MNVLALAMLCLAGCGDGDESPAGDVSSASSWSGPAASFCRGRWSVPREADDPGARLVLGPQRLGGFYLRVENFGGEDLTFGLPPLVDRNVDGRWVPQSFSEGDGSAAFTLKAYGAPVESVSRCVRVPVPGNWSTGRYRVRLPINTPDDPAEPPELFATGYLRLEAERPDSP